MKVTLKLIAVVFSILLISCGGEKKNDVNNPFKNKEKEKVSNSASKKVPASKRIDLTNKGVGPIKSVTLAENIDQKMVTQGSDIFKKMCTACHKTNKKFIGPNPTGVLKRRSPEWIMNMILNPDEMLANDPVAKALITEYNAPMANQQLKEEDARAILEYFRTKN